MIPYTLERLGLRRMDDEKYIRLVYLFWNGVEPDLDHPQIYMEKLNWIKLHDRREIYTTMVDKYRVKEYVASIIGEEHVIPLIRDSHGGVYNSFDEIDFSELPEQFVLKTNHDSGGVAICRDKKEFDIPKVRADLTARLQRNFADDGREWPYQNVKRCIIAEEYIEDLADSNYKFFCFDGKVKALYVAPFREKTVDYFDADYNHLDIYTRLHQCAPVPPERPASFEQMKEMAERISEGYPHMRVDFYDVHGKIYFGEITFFLEGGFVPFMPEKWNKIFGDWLVLPAAVS